MQTRRWRRNSRWRPMVSPRRCRRARRCWTPRQCTRPCGSWARRARQCSRSATRPSLSPSRTVRPCCTGRVNPPRRSWRGCLRTVDAPWRRRRNRRHASGPGRCLVRRHLGHDRSADAGPPGRPRDSPDGAQRGAHARQPDTGRRDGNDRDRPMGPHRPDPAAPIAVAASPTEESFVAMSADGAWLAAAAQQASLRVLGHHRSRPPDPRHRPRQFDPDHALAARFAPTAPVLAVATRNGEVRRWRVDGTAPTPLPPLGGFTSYVNDVAFDPGGGLLAAVSSEATPPGSGGPPTARSSTCCPHPC